MRDLASGKSLNCCLVKACPTGIVKKLAKECIKLFGNLRGLLAASPQELGDAGITPSCMFSIKLLRELPVEVLKQKIIERFVYKSPKEVFKTA